MYYHYKNDLRNVFINLDNVDSISLNKTSNNIHFTISGKSVTIYCKDNNEADEIYNNVTGILAKEKGVVSRQ